MLNSYQGCRLGCVMCSKVGQIKPFFSLSTGKNTPPGSGESCFILWTLWGFKPRTWLPMCWDGADPLLWRGKGGAKTYTSFCNKNQVIRISKDFAVAQSLSRVQLFATTWTAAHQASVSFTISRSLLKFTSIESTMLSNHLILCLSLLLLSSQHQGLFQRVGSSQQVAKVLELQLQHQSFQWIFSTDFL